MNLIYRLFLFRAFWPRLIISIDLILRLIFHLCLCWLNKLTLSFLLRLNTLWSSIVWSDNILSYLRSLVVLISWGILVLSKVSWTRVIVLGWSLFGLLVICHKILYFWQRLLMLLLDIRGGLSQVLPLSRVQVWGPCICHLLDYLGKLVTTFKWPIKLFI